MGIAPEYIVQGLIQRGMPQAAALGFAGNFQVESGFDPSINERNPTVEGSRGGYGLAQWTGPRRKQLEAFAASRGKDIADPDLQMDFLIWELQNTEKRAGDVIFAAQDPTEAARLVSTEFLRPGIPHLDARLKATADIAGSVGATVSASGGMSATAPQAATLTPLQQRKAALREAVKAMQVSPTLVSDAFETAQQTSAPTIQQQRQQLRIAAAKAGLLKVSPENAAAAAEMDAQSLAMMQPQQTALGQFGADISRGLGLTARAIGEGVASVPGLVYNPIAGAANAAFGTEIPTLQENAGAVMDIIGVPRPQNATERIVNAAASAMAGGGMSIGAARAVGAVPGIVGAVGQGMAAQPLAQITGAAGTGIGAQGAAEAGYGLPGQIAGGVIGGMIGGIGGAAFEPKAPPVAQTAQQATVAEAQRVGVPVMTSDVLPPQTGIGRAIVQGVPETIPIAGTGGPRAAQQAARVAAIKDLARQYGADDLASAPDDIMADLLATRGATVEKYSALKKGVIEKLSGPPVPLPKTISAIDEQIAALEAQKLASNGPVIAKLMDWRDGLMGVEVQKGPGGQTVRVAAGQPLNQVEEIRKSIGQAFNDPGLAGVKAVGEKALAAIYGPLREDMGDFIRTAGGEADLNKWGVANKELADGIKELGVAAFKTALSKGDVAPETVMRMVTGKTPSAMRLLYDNLSNKGRARVQSAIIGDVIEKSGGMDFISPERFLTDMKKRAGQLGVFFNEDEQAAIKGLQDVLAMTRRAGVANVTPPTGVQLVPYATAGAAASAASILGATGTGAAATAAAILASAGGIARVYESAPIRNLLMRYGSASPSAKPAIATQIILAINALDSKKEDRK